jgi:predicted  nucleic acid-binding Zn-ribbon protein
MAKTSVEKAKKRLDKAVSRLEALSQDDGALTAAQAGELSSLKAEREALQDTARAVSERLDSTIQKIKGVLESRG